VKNAERHPVYCRVCGDELPVRDEPRGRPRLYCPASTRPCKERQRALSELDDRFKQFVAAGNDRRAASVQRRLDALRRRWNVLA